MIPTSFSTHNFSKGYQSQKNIGVLREVKNMGYDVDSLSN